MSKTSTSHGPALLSTARGLGLFSIALGLAELLAPRAVARATGMSGRTGLIQAYGLREIVNGVGLLYSDHPRRWLWGRVFGDALDMATLATRKDRADTAAAMKVAAVVGSLDLAAAMMQDAWVRRPSDAEFDYSDRVGFARSPDEMRGAAADAMVPKDMRQPEPLRPYPAA